MYCIIASKILANRLKKVLPFIIHASQSAFVPGRLIIDNALVAYKCFHYLRKTRKGLKGCMALKLDMSKANDRVERTFLEKLGLHTAFTSTSMNCVSMASFSILVNGQPTRSFIPTRGLRQGDPLSPFLFVICAKGFSTLLRKAKEREFIHGIKVRRNVPQISQQFFAFDH